MTTRSRRLTIAEIKRALASCTGSVPRAARQLRVSRQALHYRLDHSRELSEYVEYIRGRMEDVAMEIILAELLAGNPRVARWYLLRFNKAARMYRA